MTLNIAEFIKRMPKTELHVHIEATLSPGTLREIASQNNYLNELTPGFLTELSQDKFEYKNFEHFIEIYSLCSNALRTKDDYARVTYEYLSVAHKQNIRYVEAYVSPYNRMMLGMSFEDIANGIHAGRMRAYKEFGIRADFVVDLGRHLLWTVDKDPDQARKECTRLAELAAGAQDKGIIGFSIGGKEVGYPVFPFIEGFETARRLGLKTKAHTGESITSDDTWYVLSLLKVQRIGNPMKVFHDSKLVEFIAAHGIGVELCITGGLLTGTVAKIEEHPIMNYINCGVNVALSSDDPALFDTSLTQEYLLLADAFNLTADALQNLVMMGVELTWLEQVEKSNLRASFEAEFAALRSELSL